MELQSLFLIQMLVFIVNVINIYILNNVFLIECFSFLNPFVHVIHQIKTKNLKILSYTNSITNLLEEHPKSYQI